jgi:hypothetical protein
MEFDFGNFLFGFSIGLWVSYLLINYVGKLVYNRLMAQVEQETATAKEIKRIEMKVEKHGDVWYAFDATNDDFVCQGADLKELKANFIKRFPGRDGAIVDAAKDLQEELIRQKEQLASDSAVKGTPN